jgi:hypothetical protein
MSPGQKAPIVDVSVFGLGLSIDQYAQNALNWAKREIVPRGPLFCPCLNREIHFSNKKVRHTIMHKKSDQRGNYNVDNISVLSEIEQLIQNATLRYTTSDAKERENVLSIIKLLSKVQLNDTIRDVEILIQEIYHENEGETRLHFYNHVLL